MNDDNSNWKKEIEVSGDIREPKHQRHFAPIVAAEQGRTWREWIEGPEVPDQGRPHQRLSQLAPLMLISHLAVLVAHTALPQFHQLATTLPSPIVLAAGTGLGFVAGNCGMVREMKALRFAPLRIMISGPGLTFAGSIIACTHHFDVVIATVAFSSFISLLEVSRECRL